MFKDLQNLVKLGCGCDYSFACVFFLKYFLFFLKKVFFSFVFVYGKLFILYYFVSHLENGSIKIYGLGEVKKKTMFTGAPRISAIGTCEGRSPETVFEATTATY